MPRHYLLWPMKCRVAILDLGDSDRPIALLNPRIHCLREAEIQGQSYACVRPRQHHGAHHIRHMSEIEILTDPDDDQPPEAA